MSIQSTVSLPFSYTSDISVKFECKGKPFILNFKNKGEQHLFDIITKALCGYSITDALPETFDITSNGNTCLRHPVYFSGGVWGDAVDENRVNCGMMSLNTVVTYEDKISITKLTNPQLLLKGRDGQVLCSISDIGGQIQTMWELITQDTNALIEWKLIFSNG